MWSARSHRGSFRGHFVHILDGASSSFCALMHNRHERTSASLLPSHPWGTGAAMVNFRLGPAEPTFPQRKKSPTVIFMDPCVVGFDFFFISFSTSPWQPSPAPPAALIGSLLRRAGSRKGRKKMWDLKARFQVEV